MGECQTHSKMPPRRTELSLQGARVAVTAIRGVGAGVSEKGKWFSLRGQRWTPGVLRALEEQTLHVQRQRLLGDLSCAGTGSGDREVEAGRRALP